MAYGQRVWLTAHGRDLAGEDLNQVIFDGDVVTASMLAEGPSRLLERRWLADLANNSELRLEGKVNFRGEDEAGAIGLPLRRYKIQGSRSFYLETFEECPLGLHQRLISDYFVTLHSVHVRQGAPGSGFESKFVEGGSLASPYFYADLMNAAGRTFPARKIRFSCRPVKLYIVVGYDVHGQSIADAVVTMETGHYTIATSTPIYRILIRASIGAPYLYVDNFELYPDG